VKRVLIILITLLHICTGYVAMAQQINIRSYTIEDGLVNNEVLNIYQDSYGFIWLCTRGGLSRYDGSRFTNYTTDNGLTNDMINDIYEVAPQKFIVAQNLGGPLFLNNSHISTFGIDTQITLNRFYADGSNRLLAATDRQGIVELQNNNFRPVNATLAKGIHRMAMMNDSLWIVLQQDYSVQIVTTRLNSYSALTHVDATTIYADSKQRVWLGTTKGLKLLSANQQPNKPITFILLPPLFNMLILRDSYIRDFLEDSQGNYWIATNTGLVQIQPNGNSHIYTHRNGLPASSINCVLEDRENNIWAGTDLGLAKFSLNNEVKIYSLDNGLPTPRVIISPLTENRIRIFDGIKMNELDISTSEVKNNLPEYSSGYRAYKTGKHEFLLVKGHTGKLFKDGVDSIETITLPNNYFEYAVRVDAETFLVSIDGYLFSTTNGNELKKITILLNSQITAFTPVKNDMLWIGTWQNGVYKIRLHRNQGSISVEVTDSLISELPDRYIRALYSDKENELWIGTRYKGLIRLMKKENGKYEIQNYGAAQGLSSNFVRTINRDKKGNIWVGSMQGIDKLIPSGNQYRVFNFGKINKIFSRVGDICFLKDNYLLAAGFPYLVYARDIQQDTLPPPPVYITNISAGFNDSSISLTRLPYNKAQIYFEFSAPQFIIEKFTEYSYRLYSSSDSNWTIAGKSHSVYYASLQPGNYMFEVRAMGFNGKWGNPAVHRFTVTTPFWQQAWFILLIIAVVALLVYMLYRYRIQQLIRLQKVRNRIATDLHDEIGSNLTNISILSSLSKKNLWQPQQASDFLNRISEEVSSSSQALDDIIWSVNASHDTLDETVSRMRRYAAELFDAANISYNLQLDAAFEEKKLIMEQRRDIYLLYKEAVNNIFKHAQAKQVDIKIAIEHNQLILQIKDDGKGFETNKESNRHGLQGMKDRVKKWKGKIQIDSTENKGTVLHIRLPVAS
jgi:signal transduction histidine kinase/ligand-binding sensor domain-containing protein